MFGTFAKEREPVVYGITKQLGTGQPVRRRPRVQRALPGDGIRERLGRQTRSPGGAAKIREHGPHLALCPVDWQAHLPPQFGLHHP